MKKALCTHLRGMTSAAASLTSDVTILLSPGQLPYTTQLSIFLPTLFHSYSNVIRSVWIIGVFNWGPTCYAPSELTNCIA